MVVIDDVCFADNFAQVLSVLSVEALDGYKLRVTFNDGTEYITDMTPKLKRPAFIPLQDRDVFSRVKCEHGAPSWMDGTIDIAPEWLQDHGTPVISHD